MNNDVAENLSSKRVRLGQPFIGERNGGNYPVTSKNIIQLFSGLGLTALVLVFGTGCSENELSDTPEETPRVVQSIVTPPVKEDQGRIIKESPGLEKSTSFEKEEKTLQPVTIEREGKEIQPGEVTSKEGLDRKKQADFPGHTSVANLYTVKQGDNLAAIAGRADVYGDPLKWPILYRLNYDRLNHLAESDSLMRQELSQGMKLRVIAEEERKRNLEERKNQLWVVNILSSTSEKQMVQQTARLIEKGYPVYITTAVINDTEWQRLRVGFFKTKNEADELGRDIMSKLDLADSWSTKIVEKEFEEFAGY